MKNEKTLKQTLCDLVWDGKINQMTTREVTSLVNKRQHHVREILLLIVEGESGDTRFLPSPLYPTKGVLISTGQTFTYGNETEKQNALRRSPSFVWMLT